MNSLHVAACAPISLLKGGGDKSERCPIEITYIAELETDNPPWFTIMSDLFNAFERMTTAVFFSLKKDQGGFLKVILIKDGCDVCRIVNLRF